MKKIKLVVLIGILYFALNVLFGSLLGEFGYEIPDNSFEHNLNLYIG